MIGRLTLFAALVALIAVLVEWRMFGGEEPVATLPVERPGYYLTGIQLEDFAIDGKPRLQLQAATAKENVTTGFVTLHAVSVDYRAQEGQSWHLTSDEALVPRDAHAVEFTGDVHMTGQSGKLPSAAELRTTRLALDTTREHAGTRDPVTIAFGRHVMHARGMQVDLKAGNLTLESEVNGLFTP